MADIVNKPVDPYTSQCLVIGVGSAAVGFATANIYPTTGIMRGQMARVVYAGCETTSIRFHISGITPAANEGMLWVDGDYMMLDSPSAIHNFKGVCTGATATLYITFYA